MYIGCHVSIRGGVFNAPERAADFGCEVMQVFTRSPQGGKAPKFTPEIVEKFKDQSSKFKIRNTYIHTPYYINLPSKNNRIRYGSIRVIQEELERASLIGAKYVLTHVGSTSDLGEKEGITKTIEMLQKCLKDYSGSAKLLLENSAGAGNIIGNDLKELGTIIKKINSPSIAGICLDTQHSFASGYNWNDFDKTLERIDKEIGLDTIKLIHANDSQSELGSNKDRHEHIGKGKVGLESFKKIVEFAQQYDIDMICETKDPGVKEDIETLKRIRASLNH